MLRCINSQKAADEKEVRTLEVVYDDELDWRLFRQGIDTLDGERIKSEWRTGDHGVEVVKA